MALRMFVGKPGGGKSYGALLDIVDELVHGSRVVVTNLSILPGELNAFLALRYPEWSDDIHKRLVLLSSEETKRFWLVRGPAPSDRLRDVSREDEKAGRFPDFASKSGPGCLYVIDEAHVPFDARGWAESGQSLTYYNSQHRKLNDELIFVTQFVELVDKRIRGFAQDYRYFRNNGVERVFTSFRLPAYFTCKVYQRPQTGVVGELASEVHRYRLDPAVAACYDTSAGVGISGRRRPESQKKGGLSVGWLAVPVVGLLVALHYVPELLAKGLTRATTVEAKRGSGLEGVIPSRLAGVSGAGGVVGGGQVSKAGNWSGPEVFVSGVVRSGDRVNVILSDGRVYTERDRELERVERNAVVIDGRKIFIGRAVSGGVVVKPVYPGQGQVGEILRVEAAGGYESEKREKGIEVEKAGSSSVRFEPVPSVPGRGSSAASRPLMREFPRVIGHGSSGDSHRVQFGGPGGR